MLALSPRTFRRCLITSTLLASVFLLGEKVPVDRVLSRTTLAVTSQSEYTLTASPGSAHNEAPITAAWTAPIGASSDDWVGLYKVGDPDTGYIAYVYTNGTTEGSWTRNAPSPPANTLYEFRYFLNNGYSRAATSNTITVMNQPPDAADDSYSVHGEIHVPAPGLCANDSDPEGDSIRVSNQYYGTTTTSHGRVYLDQTTGGGFVYTANLGYIGTDSFTYQVCDVYGACSSIATVTFNVVNQAPIAGDDSYVVRGGEINAPAPGMLNNDSDPDGDPYSISNQYYGTTTTAHGSVYFDQTTRGGFHYQANSGYAGTDSFTYRVCDELNGCSAPATVTLYVVADGEEDGVCYPCNKSVGSPVNVTNGNMYLQQSDYQLPSVGYGIDVTRTYNSDSQRPGLFGRGWSTAYDESVAAYDGNLLRFNQGDGRAIYFGRPQGSSGVFAPLVGDTHAQLTQGGNAFTLTLKDGSIQQFNSAGKLLSLTDRNGNTTVLAYGSSGFLSSVTDPSGRVLTITTNANGQIVSISDAIGTVATYTYGGGNELLSVTYADNSAFQFIYDSNYRLTSAIDALGNIVESHTYDGQGRAVTSEKQGGVEHYSLSYVSSTETDVTDTLSRVTKYTFDTSRGRNVVTRTEGLCNCGGGGGSQVQSWTYDNQLNVTSKTDALNHTASYTYDGNGNRLTETDAIGTVTYTYNEFAEVRTRTDQMNGVTANTYDAQGNLVSTTDARGKTTNFTSDSRGLLLTVTDARGKVTSFAYDVSGNLITKTDALSHATQFAYDARSRITSVTNALGHVTALAYDAVGRLTRVTQADGTTIRYEYDLAGRRTAMVDAKGNRSTYGYDAANRLTSETDALGQLTSSTYDSMSNLTATTDALARVTNYDYDDFNRLVKVTYPPATSGATRLFGTVEYDAVGNVTKRVDTTGRATLYQYDDVNRLTSVTDPASQVTQYEYNARSEVTALVDALSQRYRFNYNPVGQVTHVRRGTNVMSFTYDAVGNRKHRVDYNGATTIYDYDALNRLKTINYPDTTTVSYTYDKISRLQTATNENGTIDFDYNKMSRLTNVTDMFGQVVDYNYDANGNRTKLSLNVATVATYRYDALNRLTKIIDGSSLATTYGYDATNKVTSRRLPNGILTSYQYDGIDRLTRLLDSKGAATVADHQYQYNTASQITQITEPGKTRSYTYDVIDRLTSAAYTNPAQPNENYAYDAVGNRTSSHLNASYSYQPFNRLASTSTATFTYDSNGNLLSKMDSSGTTQHSWDFENRLKQVTLPNGNTVAYKYDALGRRIQRIPNAGVSTNFIYDGQDVIKDINSDGSTVDYLNGPGIDNKLRLTDSRLSAGSLYFLQDHLGSTTALTNSLGTVTSQMNYDAFGNPTTGANLTRYTYTGREFDSDTGLYYYRARWYDPKAGRFISEDPIGLAGGINQFAYVGNDPQNGKDPTGLYNEDVHYYLTYFIATKFPCLTEHEARLIADADQSTDENPETSPEAGVMVLPGGMILPDFFAQQKNAAYHGFNFGNNAFLPERWNAALNGKTNYVGLGRFLHYLQDTFSHRGFYNSVIGQAEAILRLENPLAVDYTNHDVGKAAQMITATWLAIRDWIKAKKCSCGDQGDTNVASWWPQAMEFLETDNDKLERKRQILKVPRR